MIPNRSNCFAVLFATLPFLGLSIPAFSQPLPGAAGLQRELGRALRPAEPATPLPQPAISAPMTDDAKAVRVAVKAFHIEGTSLVDRAALDVLLDDQIGKSLTFAELEAAAQRIASFYREQGWYVRVFLPAQDVTDGVLRIQVVEGHYGGVRVQAADRRANAAFVQATVTHGLRMGQPLSATQLESGLLLANDFAGIRATGVLEAGERFGETQLILKIDDTPLLTGDIAINNEGVKSTGKAQIVAGVSVNDLTGQGDQLSLRALRSEDLSSFLLRHDLPIGSGRWHLGAHLSWLGYRLGGDYVALDARGTARTAGVQLKRELIRQADRNLRVSAGYEYRRYEDELLSAPARHHRVDAFTLAAAGDLSDGLGGGGVNWGGVQLTRGRLDIGDVPVDLKIDRITARTDGSYTKLAFQGSRLQSLSAIAPNWSVLTRLSGQLADRNLESSEKFVLGGPAGVRAYPISEAPGDEGILLKIDLQWDLGQGWQASAFADTGYIRLHHSTWLDWQAVRWQDNAYRLSGAGLGLTWQQPETWRVAAIVAKPFGGNPGQGNSGRNNDGSDSGSLRFWLNMGRSF